MVDKIKLGFIIDHSIYDPFGYSIRPRELILNLSKLNCQIHIFSPVDINHKINNNIYVHGNNIYINYLTTIIHTYLRKAFKNKTISKYLYSKSLLKKISSKYSKDIIKKVEKYELELIHGEKEIVGHSAYTIGNKLHIPSFVDIHGLLADEAVQYGFINKNSIEYYNLNSFVSEVLENNDGIIYASDGLKDYFFKHINKDHIVINNASNIKNITKKYNKNPSEILYTGILEPWENIELILKSMTHINTINKNVNLLIYGSGSKEHYLKNLSKQLSLFNIHFKGKVPYEDIFNYMAMGDIGLLPSTDDIVRRVACPIKLFDYMSVGLPIITIKDLWWGKLVNERKIGMAVDLDPEKYSEAILHMISDPDKIYNYGRNARNLIKNEYNWMEMSKKLKKFYMEYL